MSQDQSPAIIDATDAQIVPAQRAISASEFNREMGVIEADLPLVAQRVKRHTEGLVYAIVECGFLLLKARALHRVATVVTRTDGTFQKQDSGFLKWIAEQNIGLSERTVYNYITSAENAGLTADSDPAEIQKLRERDALADKTPEKLRRRQKRHEPAAEIEDGDSTGTPDFNADWEVFDLQIKDFFKGWTAATWKHLQDRKSFEYLTRKERGDLLNQVRDVYHTLRDFVQEEDRLQKPAFRGQEKKTKPAIDKAKQPPPDLGRTTRFEFEKPRGARKLKGGRFFYGHQTPEGKIVLTVYRGKQTEAGAAEFKAKFPGITLVGPFYTTSLRYAKDKVKKALSGEPQTGSSSDAFESEKIFVP